MKKRAAGLLLHPTSLPGRFGIGDLVPDADAFLDWAASAGQGVWQVLPVNATGFGNSPYGTLSAFAGNPLLVSPELLARDGFLPADSFEKVPPFPDWKVDFEQVLPWKHGVLRASWEYFRAQGARRLKDELQEFSESPDQAPWLDDWTLFCALKARFSGRSWTDWDEPYRRRDPAALARAGKDLAAERAYHGYLQYLFYRQWERLKGAAHGRGMRILGDIPIYLALDSADVWANQRLFELDADGRPAAVAGVPPDYFSETGQLWGNPLYRWEALEADGYRWWIERIRANLRLTDLLRLDHFRGFAGYWAVPFGEETAVDGAWRTGPGTKLFRAVAEELGEVEFVAEDLGEITPDVTELLEETGFPGMRILQFAFGGDDEEYQPHNHVPNCVVYTGTHDNDTTRGWWESIGDDERRRTLDYVGGNGGPIEWELIRAAYTSVAGLAMVPVQDVIGHGSWARMNTPGKGADNWAWRVKREELTEERAGRLRSLAQLTGRFVPEKAREKANDEAGVVPFAAGPDEAS